MQRSLRRIIFYSFVLAFAIAGPLVVAYSFGYTFDLSTATIATTGGILVKSSTPRLTVFLDGSFLKETGLITGSMLVTDVEPGTRLVRLEKTGFRSWSKPIAVSPLVVTELRNIILVPHPLLIATSSAAELAAAEATTTAANGLALSRRGELILNRDGAVKKIAENAHSFTANEEAIFFVDQNGFLARYALPGGDITLLGRPGFFLEKRPMRFVAGRGLLAILDSSGGLYLFSEGSTTAEPVEAGVKDVAFDSRGEKMLIVKDTAVDLVWLKDNAHQPFEKKGTREEILRSPVAIREARWLFQTDAHVVWRTREGIFLTEIDGRGGRTTTELVSGAVDELLTLPSLPNTIFYKKGKAVYKIEL